MPGAKNNVSGYSRNGFFQVGNLGVTPSEFKIN